MKPGPSSTRGAKSSTLDWIMVLGCAPGCRKLYGGGREFVARPTERFTLSTDDDRARVDPVVIREGSCVPMSIEECYLVDPASSHMLVSKIKPCMCKYELIQTVKLRMAH